MKVAVTHTSTHHRRHVGTANTHLTHVMRVSGHRYRTLVMQPARAGRRGMGQQLKGQRISPKTANTRVAWEKMGDGIDNVRLASAASVTGGVDGDQCTAVVLMKTLFNLFN